MSKYIGNNYQNMHIYPVDNLKAARTFTQVPKTLYKDDPVWVCSLDQDIDAIFDPEQNVYYKHGKAVRWILKTDEGDLIGRIAAFIDHKTAKAQDQPTGGIGFFECINDQKAADLLFDTAKSWLTDNGMEAMDGPINFGETDSYWGLLIEGFTHPSYEIAYNPPYYQSLFESYGFRTYYKQEGFHLDIKKEFPERFMKIAKWVAKKPEYTFRHFSWKDQDKFVADFAEVFNIAWASFKENFEPMQAEYIQKTLKKAKAIIDEEFIWIAYRNDQPIAIYLMYPDVNQILKKLDGKLHLWNKLKFLWYKKTKTITRARGVLMGVIPKYQGLGIESAFIWNLIQVFKKKKHYKEIEFSWVGDFNPKMRKIFISVGSIPVKHYITYRYLFDRSKEFKRYPIGGG
ncbi:MAG: GNAT family N-acetyltransferase [Bacteroidota bacterium]|nr:GNAT family N-acetyltransferase [Bacteroidota bacterium]